jgi:hypothetical protein
VAIALVFVFLGATMVNVNTSKMITARNYRKIRRCAGDVYTLSFSDSLGARFGRVG